MSPTDITTRVAETIAHASADTTSANGVLNKVVTVLADREIERRVQALLTGLERLKRADLDVKKIKPDQQSFNGDGQPVGEGTYSKAKAEELKKAREAHAKILAAINKALVQEGEVKPDYGPLFQLLEKTDKSDNKVDDNG